MTEPPSAGPATRATITTSAAGWFEAVSPAFLALIERPVESLTGVQVLDLIHPLDAPNLRQRLADAASAERSSAPTTTSARIFDAAERWVPVSLLLRSIGEGRVLIDLSFSDEVQAQAAPATTPATILEPVAAAVPAAPTTPFDDFPGPDVPMQRLAVRATVGVETTPMIEIDPEGRTTYVHGDWQSLDDPARPDGGRSGVDSFEDLLQRCSAVDAVGDAIGDVLDNGRRGRVELTVPDGRTRWVHVVPIPNPLHAGVLNALVAVTANPELGAFDAAPPSPRPPAAPAEAIEALARITAAQATRPRTVGSAPLARTASTSVVADEASTSPPAADAAAISPVARLERSLAKRNLTLRQAGAVAAVVLVALLLRTYDLSILPRGLHGDEGITGQEARRVLDDGSIGIYTGSALGQPTLPFYLNAITLALFGNTVWAMRIVAAIGGTLAVAAMYVVVQRRFDHRTGIAAAAALATMTWSIHFSRIAFGMAWWPLVTLLAITAIDRATRANTPMSWFMAGGLSILGVYVYNSHWTFGLVVTGFLAVWLANKVRQRYALPTSVLFAPVGAFVVGLPMILFVLDSDNGYFNHFDLVSRRTTPEWTDAGLFGKFELFVRWYLEAWNRLLFAPQLDGVDASGVIKQVPLIFVALMVVGLVQVLRRHRTPFVAMLLLTALVLPIGPAITIDAATRRDFAMVLTFAVLSGIGAVTLITFVDGRLRAGLGRSIAVALGVVVLFTSVIPYFTQFRRDPSQRWVFVEELALVADAVEQAREDRPVFVNFYSARHYWEYSTLDYLLDSAPGINRAPLDQGYLENPSLDLAQGVDEDQLFVFVGDYANNLPQLQARYPQGRLIADSQVAPRVVAYEVPAG